MSFGEPDPISDLAAVHRLVTIDAVCAVSGLSPNAAVKRLLRLAGRGTLVKAPFIGPRCYWHPRRPLGTQALILASSVLYRCILAEPRTWTPEGREGPATLIACGGEKEALFVDYGAEPRSVVRKLSDWSAERDTSGLTALGVVVATVAKAESIQAEVMDTTTLPIRFTICPDLRSLTCAKAPL